MSKDKTSDIVNVAMPRALWLKMRKQARKEDRSTASLVRLALKEFLEKAS